MISAIQAVSRDIIQVNEFTTLLDNRQSTPTVGYLIELAGAPGLSKSKMLLNHALSNEIQPIGPNAHLAQEILSEGLAVANAKFQMVLEDAKVCIPSVRLLSPGTFAAFRQWKAEKMSIGPGQVKVPAVLVNEASRKWMLQSVVGEL